jgi:hypothetical protein
MTGKKYFPNNWQRYKNAPDSMFHQHTFEEIMNFKINGWELHDNVACIIREQNTRTGKVKEHVYQLQKTTIDFHFSIDTQSFWDIWHNGTGVSFHMGRLRLDLCCTPRSNRGSIQANGDERRHDPPP